MGRIWGFMKYHHPEIAKGNFNWDYELFRFLPKYLKVQDKVKRDNLILNCINSYGQIKKCKYCKATNKDAFIKPDLKWIEQQGSMLKNTLLKIYKNRSQGKQYYINSDNYVGNPIFKNENSYSQHPFPDDGFRLLSLYRYWNMIHYYFPYKHLMDENWNQKLKRIYSSIYPCKKRVGIRVNCTSNNWRHPRYSCIY